MKIPNSRNRIAAKSVNAKPAAFEIMDDLSWHKSTCRAAVGEVRQGAFCSDVTVELDVYNPAANGTQGACVFVQLTRFGWEETVERSTTTTEKADLALDVRELPALIACLQRAWELAQRAGAIS